MTAAVVVGAFLILVGTAISVLTAFGVLTAPDAVTTSVVMNSIVGGLILTYIEANDG